MTSKENFYFAGKCLTLDEHPQFREEIIQRIESESVNWEEFVCLCSNHLILPAIYLKFSAHDLLPYLPRELTEFMNEIYELNRSRNHQILQQLHAIIKILNEHDIYPTLLKGAGNLLDHLYGNPGERLIGDIDLLVSEADYLPAAHLLEREGYSSSAPVSIDAMKSKHYPRLWKKDVCADVEIHRMPVERPYNKWFNTEIINSQKRALDEKASYFVISDQHKVIHNFIHSQLSHRGDADGIVSFRDMYDLYLLSNRISIASTLPLIQYKRKAISYFVFAGKALGLPKRFYAHNPLSARLFCLKHDMNQSSANFRKAYRGLRYLYEKIILGYSAQLIKSFYSKEMRQSILARLSKPQWYKNHWSTYISFFTSNK